MPLKLMYITNEPDVARIAEDAGVDRIFIDMEYIGKAARQGGMDTVQSHHTVEDIARIRPVLQKAELLVRVNPVHEGTEEEVCRSIENGADILMLPYFKTPEEVRRFIAAVNGRAHTMLLLETREAVEALDDILAIDGIDEIHIGLNDLSLSFHMPFMFELLSNGMVEELCARIRRRGIPYGFGGIAALGRGMLPAERIIREHYRLGSGCVILSRSFCNTQLIRDKEEIKHTFETGIADIRALEEECRRNMAYFRDNEERLKEAVRMIEKGMGA